MKLRYLSLGLAVIAIGILAVWQASLISRILLTKTTTIEVPRKDFRLLVERVWKGDVVRFDIGVQGGEDDLHILIERIHFYIGPRQEYGAPASIFSTVVHGPDTIHDSDSVTLDIDLGGHLNILLNNTASPYPKTVTFTRAFEKSTNVEYGAKIIRNMCILFGGVSLFIGLLENYEEIRDGLKRGPEKIQSSHKYISSVY